VAVSRLVEEFLSVLVSCRASHRLDMLLFVLEEQEILSSLVFSEGAF
jgi:hypothetical protein